MGRDVSAYPSCVLYMKHRLSILPLVGWVDRGLYIRCFLQAISSFGLIFRVSVHKPLKATERMVVRENSCFYKTLNRVLLPVSSPWTAFPHLCGPLICTWTDSTHPWGALPAASLATVPSPCSRAGALQQTSWSSYSTKKQTCSPLCWHQNHSQPRSAIIYTLEDHSGTGAC